MHLLDLKGELALLDNIVVELVPLGERCESRSRELGQRAEVQAIDGQPHEI